VIPEGEDVKTGNLCVVFPSKKAFLIIDQKSGGVGEEVGNLSGVSGLLSFFTPENLDTL